MAGNGKLEGPLYTNPGAQGGLGGEPVKKLPALSPPDPLGLVKAKEGAPMDPRAMLAALAGAAGAPPAGGMPSAPPNMAALGSVGQEGLSALDRLVNKDPNGQLAIEQVKKALHLAQQLIGAALPHVTTMNPQVAKDLHVIGRQVADARINLDKEDELGMPPEAMMMGIQGTGLPGGPGAGAY